MKILLAIILAATLYLASMIDTSQMIVSCNIKGYKSQLTINECYKSKVRILKRGEK